MRKHTNERPYSCEFCGVSFRQSTDLKSHKRTHTGEKRVLCTVCGKKLSTTGKKLFISIFLIKLILFLGQLTIHLRSHTGEKPFSCSVCKKSFTTKSSLIKHKRIHTGKLQMNDINDVILKFEIKFLLFFQVKNHLCVIFVENLLIRALHLKHIVILTK